MGDRMQRMRTQGKLVEGLAKLHAFFTKVNEKHKMGVRQLIFTTLLSHGISHRRRQAAEEPDDYHDYR